MTLKTERETPTMGRRILRAARRAQLVEKPYSPRGRLAAVFEHWQWWIIDNESGAIWAVCDSEGPPPVTIDGFSFEQVHQGDQ